MESRATDFDQYLQQLMHQHNHCLLLIANPWSGHAQLYERMLQEVVLAFTPSPELVLLSSQTGYFDLTDFKMRGSPLLYYLQDGQLKGVIKGIPTRSQLTNQLQSLQNI